MLQKLAKFFGILFSFFKAVFNAVLGDLNYQPPRWWQKFSGFVSRTWFGKKWQQLCAWKKTNPELFQKRAVISSLAVVVLAGGALGAKKYWDSRPKPDYVTMEATPPYPMDLETKIPSTVAIRFSKSAAKPGDLNKAITSGIEMKPSRAGVWMWTSDRVLVFTPDKEQGEWPVGEEFEVSFKKDFFPAHLIFDDREVEFKTQKIKSSVYRQEFYIDPRNAETKKVVVTIGFNYPINPEEVRKRVSFELENQGISLTSRKVPFTMTHNKHFTEFYFQSENLSVPVDNQRMIVKLEDGVKPLAGGKKSDEEEEVSITVPSRYEALRYGETRMTFVRNEKYEPEQIILVHTTANARTEDVAKLLKVKLLPLDKPAFEGEKAIPRYRWESPSEISSGILAESTDVSVQMVPSEDEWSKIHTFKIQADPERSLYLSLAKGLSGLGGYEVKEAQESILFVEPYPQELSIMSKGSILTLSGDLKLPLLARNVGRVEYTIHRVIPDQANHLLYQMTGDVAKPYIPYGLESQIAEKFQSTVDLKIESAKATQYFSFDLAPFVSKSGVTKGLFILQVRAKNPDNSEGVMDQRLIMITDLGLLVKETVSNSHEVFVQNFRTGTPVEGATVEVVGTNGLTVLKAQTDGQGRVSFPDLKDFKNEKNPIAFAVRRGEDQAYLPYRNYTQRLQYSRFDIGGLHDSSSSDQLMSMVFSDRGIYRPGEEVNLGVILRSKKGKSAAQKPPLEWVVTDPRGTVILREKITIKGSDLKDLRFSTEPTSPTGVYDIRIYLIKKETPHREIELIGSQTVKVEEFQPDRLKIQVHLEPEKLIGWISPQEMKAQVSLRNMFGTAAENRVVKGELVLSPTAPVFKEYRDYTFTNLNTKDEQVFTETLGEVKTDDNGEAQLAFNLTKYESPLFSLRLNAEGFDSEGGRSVKAVASALVSPLEFILGAKPDGDLNYLKKDSERNVNIIAINSDLKKMATDKVTLVVMERKYVSVLTQGDDGNYRYQSVFKETMLSEKPFAIAAAGSNLKIDTTKPGSFTLVFRNAQKFDVLKINYDVVGEGNLTRSLEKNAELQISLSKTDFKNGEEIEMQIKAPYKGAGLISIERDGVYATKWFKTTSSSTIERIRVPEGLDGNAYVNVTFLRAIDSQEIYTSPLSYAVAPFSVSLDEHRTQIKLETPALVKPGQKLQVKYSANKKTDIILYGVDEGILQVARYKLPEPLGFFFQKRALQVRTFQMLDLLLPEFSIIQQLQATGGDGGFGAIGKNLNPFQAKRLKPVVFWSGVISADTTTKTYTYEVPDTFNGNMKIMAVAAGPQGLGSTQNDALVRGDLIITPNVPVFVAPNDEFTVGLSVSNQTEGSGPDAKVKLETTASSHLQVTEGKTLELGIAEGRESGAEVRVKALEQLGVADITFAASLGKAQAKTKWEISVRPSTPYLHFLQNGLFTGSAVDLKNSRKLYKEFAQTKVSASGSPFVLATGLVDYLEAYPYGCTEQMLSKAVPALALRTQAEFLPDAAKIKLGFKKVLQVLATRQKPDGGFALYNPAYGESSPAVSLYAAHYLIEARAKGLEVPEDMIRRAKSYLGTSGIRNGGGLVSLRRWAYSLYLDARLGTVNGASLAQLRRELETNFKGDWEKDIVAIYMAGVYSLYKQDDQGEKLMRGLDLGQVTTLDYENYLDGTTRDSVLLYVAGKHYPALLKNLITEKKMDVLMKPINQGLYHTHSVGRLLMGLDAVSSSTTVQTALAQLQLEISKGNQWSAVEPSQKQPKIWNLPLNTPTAKISGGNGPLFYSFSVSGFDQAPAPIKKGVEVSRQYVNQDGKEVAKVKIGDEVTVRLQVRSLSDDSYFHMAMVDLIPSGFELITEARNTALENQGVDEAMPNGGDEYEGGEGEYEGEGEGEGAFWKMILPPAYAQTTNLSPMQTQFVDEREDRLVIYYTATKDLTEYTYRIKAVNKGKFVTPPVFTEGMYNRDVQFLGEASFIEVEGGK